MSDKKSKQFIKSTENKQHFRLNVPFSVHVSHMNIFGGDSDVSIPCRKQKLGMLRFTKLHCKMQYKMQYSWLEQLFTTSVKSCSSQLVEQPWRRISEKLEIPWHSAVWHASAWYLQSSQSIFLSTDWLYPQELKWGRPNPLCVSMHVKVYLMFGL